VGIAIESIVEPVLPQLRPICIWLCDAEEGQASYDAAKFEAEETDDSIWQTPSPREIEMHLDRSFGDVREMLVVVRFRTLTAFWMGIDRSATSFSDAFRAYRRRVAKRSSLTTKWTEVSQTNSDCDERAVGYRPGVEGIIRASTSISAASPEAQSRVLDAANGRHGACCK
jgi:hypothetical protein